MRRAPAHLRGIPRGARPERIAAALCLALLAAGVGIASGGLGLGFVYGVDLLQRLLLRRGGSLLSAIHPALFLLVPVLGGLGVGVLVHRMLPEARRGGIPALLAALSERAGRVRPLEAVVGAVAVALGVSTGSSVGREGPIAYLGAALGSTSARIRGLPDDLARLLAVCGAAGGIAASFDIPISALLLAMEVLLPEVTGGALALVAVAAGSATLVGRLVLGTIPILAAPMRVTLGPFDGLAILLFGALTAPVAVAFAVAVVRARAAFGAWGVPPVIKPAVGGLLVGLIALAFPQVLGTGANALPLLLSGRAAAETLVLLALLKIGVTAIAIGSGVPGGVFLPCLFVGAALGEAYGIGVHSLWPGAAAAGAYGLLGLGVTFGGAARAPLTGAMLLAELTGQPALFPPALLASAAATFIADRLSPQSIYTAQLLQQHGIRAQGCYAPRRVEERRALGRESRAR